MWADLENLLIKVYADEGRAIEAMRGLTNLTEARDQTTRELGTRATNLSAIAFPEKY